MKIAFPHMGNVYITVKGLLDDLNIDYAIAPMNSKRTLELGSRYTPEGACLPLKITVGNLIQAHELGADTQLMIGSWGPCRFGYYCQMQKEILEDLGLNMDSVILETCSEGLGELVRRIYKLTGTYNIPKIANVLRRTTSISHKIDKLERLYRKTATYEAERGKAEAIYNGFRLSALNTKGTKEIISKIGKTENELKSIELNFSVKPLKIGVVGEIYGIIDSWTNLRLESRLCNMGIEVERYVTISDWITEYMIKSALPIFKKQSFAKPAEKYISHNIGGHTRETVGHAVMHAMDGYDGIIQLYPLGCMPEIIAKSLLIDVSKDYDIPILTLVMDEMTGEAGYMTRVEAFVDLLQKRKERKKLPSVSLEVSYG